MVSMAEVFNNLALYYSKNELLWFVSSISRFHRIQGCSELEIAAEFIRRELLDVENFDINLYKFNYGIPQGIHHDIVGWDVKDGFTYIYPRRKIVSSFTQSKTTVVAHSPGGDVEAEVVYVGDGFDLNKYKDVDGKIVLSYGSPYLVYRIGCRFNAVGFIFFRKRAPKHAVPYIGLFLSKNDLKECRAPAVSIPKEEALRIVEFIERGDKVKARIYVEASFKAEAYAPVLEVVLGEGDSEIHMYAHMCHPAGTVNDNVSGVASLLELIHTFDRGINKSILDIPNKRRLVFAFFPEYYGSFPYLLKKVEKSLNIEFGINLDMIGEKQWLTNSTLHIIRPPRILSKPSYEALTLKLLFHALSKNQTFSNIAKTMAYRLDVTPYDSGSDHDIYLQFGIPSIMINQWPDTFYHSDMDTVDKFDPDIASSIAIAVGTTSYTIALEHINSKTLRKIADSYTDFINGYSTLKLPDLEKEVTPEKTEATYMYAVPRGIITTKFIVDRLGIEKSLEIMKVLEDRFVYHLFSRYIPLHAMLKPIDVNTIYNHIVNDYGYVISINDIKKLLSYLESLGIISKVSTTALIQH